MSDACHQVQAGGDAVAQHVVGVHGAACVAVGTDAHAGAGLVLQLRRLAHQVQAATTGITAGVGWSGPLTLPPAPGRRSRGSASRRRAGRQRRLLCESKPRMNGRSRRIAAFAGTEGDARAPAQRILQVGRTGFGDLSFSDTIDTDFGMSSSSAVNFGEDGLNQLPRTYLSSSVALREPASALSAPAQPAARSPRPGWRWRAGKRAGRACGVRSWRWVVAWIERESRIARQRVVRGELRL